MNKIEEKIYNKGERCIPDVTHDAAEANRHRSRYIFFRRIIEKDIVNSNFKHDLKILDLGCGVGYGSEILSNIQRSNVTGIDVSSSAIKYAQCYYNAANIKYLETDIQEFTSKMETFDYVVSSEVVEHVVDGFELFSKIRFKKLLMMSAPYLEQSGNNKYHNIFNISEGTFTDLFNVNKFYFQTIDGRMLNKNIKLMIHFKAFGIFLKIFKKFLKYDFRINNIIAILNA